MGGARQLFISRRSLGGGRISCGPAETLCSSSSSMDGSRTLRRLLLPLSLSLLLTASHVQEESESEKPEAAADRDLVEALEVLLGRMRVSSTEKRGIPLCGTGIHCAMKFGSCIGKLCNCGQGANCNLYLLKWV